MSCSLRVAAWYKKGEQAKRVGCFYVMNGVTSMLGGLMAYGVTFYNGCALLPTPRA
mgnify:CR=1 FL=1